jgi:hypothetical protein
MRTVLLGSAAVLFCACTTTVVTTRPGTTSIRWSIEGSFDPRACDAHGAASAAVDVYFSGGGLATSVTPYCSDFGANLTLADGFYTVSITLLDRNGAPISTTVNVPPFRVSANLDTPVDVDFPADSFFVASVKNEKGENR